MTFQVHSSESKRPMPIPTLTVLASALFLAAIAIFLYFFIAGDFHIHSIVALGCFWLSVCGIFLALVAHLSSSEKSAELISPTILKQVRRWSWLSLAGFYLSSLSLFAGLIFFAQPGELWRNSIPLFVASILSLLVFLLGLLQRSIIIQGYKLEKQYQEMTDAVNMLRQGKIKDLDAGALFA